MCFLQKLLKRKFLNVKRCHNTGNAEMLAIVFLL